MRHQDREVRQESYLTTKYEKPRQDVGVFHFRVQNVEKRMDNLERNCKIVSWILTFIFFEIILVNIFDRTIILIGISTYIPSFTLALMASTILFERFKEKFTHAIRISYLFYMLGRICR
ncbi:hypothetical protein EGU14_17920 [Acinetobacter baumannii]|nr:hypothetical protein EGU14_17920 [Acinetobacter baumannii]RSH70539.1 hypothetical protein EGU12_17960 [Acinetobacter baumannii]